MKIINKIAKVEDSKFILFLTDGEVFSEEFLEKDEISFFKNELSDKKDSAVLISPTYIHFAVKSDSEDNTSLEKLRRLGGAISSSANNQKAETINIVGGTVAQSLAIAEGIALANYSFQKYNSEKKESALKNISLLQNVPQKELDSINIQIEAVYCARDLVNEPVITLNTEALAEKAKSLAEDCGAKVEIFSKTKIESLQMGGLLAVNKGSDDPPAFVVLEWMPENAKNENPIALVGKGVVYDTGGYNLKTGAFMTDMKMDMGGAAVMLNTFWAVAKAKLPIKLICLLPITDNRINGKAVVSGDIIKMHNGATVEIINTDAEGRLILADAISYAGKYNPELIIDAATLTGSAERAIGKYAILGMGNADEKYMKSLKSAAMESGERLVEFPFWDDYAESLKSEIADMKNLGSPNGGAIVAGKFLEKFTKFPFIHLDIAGVSYAESSSNYLRIGGTGVGIRTLFSFLAKTI